jgi:hypothetical protein
MNDRVNEELLAEAAGQHVDELFGDIEIPVLNFLDFIQADGEELSTDSSMVAAAFKRSHDGVLKSVSPVRSTNRLSKFLLTSC